MISLGDEYRWYEDHFFFFFTSEIKIIVLFTFEILILKMIFDHVIKGVLIIR